LVKRRALAAAAVGKWESRFGGISKECYMGLPGQAHQRR
jgi:hypothetical protein